MENPATRSPSSCNMDGTAFDCAYSSIQTGQQHGMQTLDQNLQDLVKRGLVTRQQAMGYARNKDIFKG